MDKLSADNEQRLKDAILLLDRIVATGNAALKKFPTDHYELIVFTFINYLERFVFNLDSINILLRQYKTKPNVETAIGLVIRASLLDFMTITYLSSYQADIKSKDDKEGEAKFDKQFDGLIADQIYNTIKYLKLTRDTGLITQADYKKALENSWHTYNFVFTDTVVDYDNPEKKLISREHKSPKELFTRIHNHPLTKKFSIVYDLYTYYSKYEHFGIMTHFIQRQGLDNDFDTMIAAMKYMVRGIGASFAFLSYPTDKLTDERKLLLNLQEDFDKL